MVSVGFPSRNLVVVDMGLPGKGNFLVDDEPMETYSFLETLSLVFFSKTPNRRSNAPISNNAELNSSRMFLVV